jgi:hypothetical protein
MDEQAQLDKEIKIARIDYDIAAFQARILDERRKLLEAQGAVLRVKAAIIPLEAAIKEKQAAREEILTAPNPE